MTDKLSRSILATLDLEPIDPARFKAAGSTATWESFRGKRNRIALGQPLCLTETALSTEGLLTSKDLEAYPTDKHQFHRLDLALTLLPDQGCRFRSADLIIHLTDAPSTQTLPYILRLRPEEEITRSVLKTEEKDENKVSVVAVNLGPLKVELGGSTASAEEVERMSVRVGGFGAGTQEAGWRLQVTEARDIPLNTTGLEALVVAPLGARVKADLRIVAEIEIHSQLDRWLTWAFKGKLLPGVNCSFTFPG